MIPESFKNDLLNRVDIVDVINARVPLKKSGANYVACCPFHSEKTPSFTVSQPKQFYHCFGCGAHGNAIGFLMEYAGLGYVEAVRDLAETVGMKLPELEPRRGAREAPRGPDLYELMDRAARYYRERLKHAPAAVEYLKRRGLTGKVAARFGIGYAPPGWQNLQAVFADYDDKALLACGLVIENEPGRRYDRFRDRIVFPILNQRGLVVGFGGRLLEAAPGASGPQADVGPKYLNSPETPLFEKGRELYGFVQARAAIRAENRVVVVEGYMDVVALAQHGVENVVATLGTATTPAHVQKLLRQSDEVVFCFDGDAAGRRAAWHALEVSLACLADGKAVRFLFLPEEHDPDSYVRALGGDAFVARIGEAQPLSRFLLDEVAARVDLASLEGRSRLISEARPLLARLAAPALQVQLVRAFAELARMAPDEVGRLCGVRVGGAAAAVRGAASTGRSASGGAWYPPASPAGGRARELERTLLGCLLAEPALARDLPAVFEPDDTLEAQALIALGSYLREHAGEVAPGALVDGFADAPFAGLLAELRARLLEMRTTAEDARVLFAAALARLQSRRLKLDIEALERKQSEEGLTPEDKQHYNRLIREQKSLEQTALRPAAGEPI
ncbi:MAG: DNA primase [Burkholderiales bacterium]|nr:DNA primase [Burkholderiales bacterium]